MSRRRSVVLIAAAAAALLGGCSSVGAQDAPATNPSKIATLATAEPTPTESAADALEKKYGPASRLRIDMSETDQDRAYEPFNSCVADHTPAGSSAGDTAADDDGMSAASPEKSAADEKAQELCRPLEPQPPWEYDRDNPDAQRFVEAVIDCLKTKGIPDASIAPDDGDGRISVAFNSRVGQAMAAYPVCERQVSERK